MGFHYVDTQEAGRIGGGLAISLRSWSKTEDGPYARSVAWHDARDYCAELIEILGEDLHNMMPRPFVPGCRAVLELLWIDVHDLWDNPKTALCVSAVPDKLPALGAARINALERRADELTHPPISPLIGNPHVWEVVVPGAPPTSPVGNAFLYSQPARGKLANSRGDLARIQRQPDDRLHREPRSSSFEGPTAVFFPPCPPRDPSEPLSRRDLCDIAEKALELVRIVRSDLPVVGDPDDKCELLLLDESFGLAGSAYRYIERMRNPRQYPWKEGGGGTSVFLSGAPNSFLELRKLYLAANRICEHYGWQGVSDESRRPFSDVRGGGTIPPIAPLLLDKLEMPAKVLLESNRELATKETGDREPGSLTGFAGGQIVFFRDRVELCGVDICSGPKSETKRKALEALRQQEAGKFLAYGSEEMASICGVKGAAGLIRDLRDQITRQLKSSGIECGREDVILSGGPGYRFTDRLSVQDGDQLTETEIRDIDLPGDVPNVPNQKEIGVPIVPNQAAADVPNVPDDQALNRREWIMQRLKDGERLQAPAVAKQFNCSLKTAKRDLQALKEEEAVEFVGSTRTGYITV